MAKTNTTEMKDDYNEKEYYKRETGARGTRVRRESTNARKIVVSSHEQIAQASLRVGRSRCTIDQPNHGALS